jgi:hypothetical protein
LPAFLGFNQFTEHCPARFQLMLQLKHRRRDGACIRARQTDDANPPATGRSGYRNNRVVEVHAAILTGRGVTGCASPELTECYAAAREETP